jgi:hypothetical protein
MMDAIPWSMLSSAGPASIGWGLVAYFVHLLFAGKLIPLSIYQDQRDAVIAWRKAFEAEREAKLDAIAPMASALATLPPRE